MGARLLSVALGLSAWSWAALGLIAGERPLLVRLTIAALNLAAGTSFLVRRSASRGPSATQVVAALPSMVVGASALRLAPDDWSFISQVVFVAGGGIAVLSLATLGRSFALFPAVREIVTTGPFGTVRHPIYTGEIVMIVAAGLARSPWCAGALGVLSTLLLLPRIRAEEALLSLSAEYRAYTRSVPDRLIPGVW